MSEIMWFLIGGPALMMAAVLSDPRGRSRRWAAAFLLGAAIFIIGIAG